MIEFLRITVEDWSRSKVKRFPPASVDARQEPSAVSGLYSQGFSREYDDPPDLLEETTILSVAGG